MTLWVIGISCSALQPLPSQATASELFALSAGEREFRSLLGAGYPESEVRWGHVWQRSLAMGNCVSPFLRAELNRENHVVRRMVLTGATILAAGRADVAFFDSENSRRTPRERFMALFGVALGPRQAKGADVLLAALERRPLTPLEQIAACLALARFGDRGTLPRKFTEKAAETGVLAAALYCRPEFHRPWIENRLRRGGTSGHQDLVWRGYLLGESCSEKVDEDRLQLAVEVLRRGEGTPSIPTAAAWYLGAAVNSAAAISGSELRRLSLESLLLLARSKGFRSQIMRHPAVPPITAAPHLQLRWFTLYATSAPEESVAKALAEWRTSPTCREPETRLAIGLALAARLLRRDPKSGVDLGWETDWLGAPAGDWLRLARDPVAGAEAKPRLAGDPRLDAALRLAHRGRLPRAAAADHLDQALWRLGAHVGLCGLELHRQLLAELMIDGCKSAGPNFVPSTRKPYTAAGPDRGDVVFRLARQMFKLVTQEEPWSRPEYRLQN